MQGEKLRNSLIAIWFICGSGLAAAHEFWVSPQSYRVEPGAEVVGALRVGKMMSGSTYPYLSHKFQSFTVSTAGGISAIEGIQGDTPALSYTAEEPGLHTVTYHSTASETTYDDWASFRNYLQHEGLEEIEPLHRARGLPDSGFKESYARYAKSLLQVGPVRESDRDKASGAALELVAMVNPYTPGLKTLRVKLLREGEPVTDRQIAVFNNDGDISRTVVLTDESGEALIPIAGGGEFLLNATDLQPADEGAVVWRSYWASLTFGLAVDLSALHPLDPLKSVEITRAIGVIGKSGHANAATRVSLMTLAPADKTDILNWSKGKPGNRKAFAVIRNGPEVFEATVDLASGTLEHWQAIPDVQPAIQSTEWALAERLTKQDPRWISGMKLRGYTEFSQIFCESLSAGYFDLPEERGKRLLKMPCYDRSDSETNSYGRPIEGLVSVVDLNTEKVLQVIDSGLVPVSTDNHDFGLSTEPELHTAARPARDTAPGGWNFTIDNRLINWQAWSFHLGFDQRFGAVLSLVTHRDGPSQRSVLYQGHLSEIFVPYMDPGEGWYYRSYMDSGEYGLGLLASPLNAGVDCPEQAVFLDAKLASPVVAPYTRERVMCVFERDTAEPLWRHWEALNGS